MHFDPCNPTPTSRQKRSRATVAHRCETRVLGLDWQPQPLQKVVRRQVTSVQVGPNSVRVGLWPKQPCAVDLQDVWPTRCESPMRAIGDSLVEVLATVVAAPLLV